LKAQLFVYILVSQYSEATAAPSLSTTSRVSFNDTRCEVLVPIYQHHQSEQYRVDELVALHIGSERVRQAVQQALL